MRVYVYIDPSDLSAHLQNGLVLSKLHGAEPESNDVYVTTKPVRSPAGDLVPLCIHLPRSVEPFVRRALTSDAGTGGRLPATMLRAGQPSFQSDGGRWTKGRWYSTTPI